MISLSIIIPAYNVEQYLAKCIDTVLMQDIPYVDYEVIVVNDGSPDGSLAIAEDYSKKYSNIKVVSRPNGGLSAARNTGLIYAQGKYVWFVDSDDWIEPNVIGGLLKKVEEENLDVLCFNLQLCYEDGSIKKYNIPASREGVLSGSEFLSNVCMPPAAWAAFYRRDFLLKNNLKFYEGILHEDQEFTPRVYFLAERISLEDIVVYNYFQRSGSIMKSNRSVKRCKDLLTVADSLYDFMLNNIQKTDACFSIFQDKVNFAFSQSLVYYSKEAFPIKVYKEKLYYPVRNIQGLKMKYKLMNISLPIYLFVLSLKKK